MAKKVTPKKAASNKKSAPKSTPKKAVAKPVAKSSKSQPKSKASAKKVVAKPVVKKSVAKPVSKKAPVKSAPKKNAKTSVVSSKNSKKSAPKVVAKKPVAKSQQKKTIAKPVAKSSKPQPKSKVPTKKISREMERRAAVNAKAAPKKSVSQKKITTPKSSVKTNPKSKAKKETVDSNSKSKKSLKSAASKKAPVETVEPKVREVSETRIETAPPITQARGGKFRVRPSNNIYFSLEDLDSYLARREVVQASAQVEKSTKKTKQVVPQVAQKRPVVAVPRPPLAVATVFDILGITPATPVENREKLDEQDVPRKWKKYYKLLVDLRTHHSSGVETRAEEVMKRSAKDDAGDLSSYGQHLADAGSESFERDMAYNIISNQKEILSEIDEAIKRIKNGTYGICEITGLPIPESRLMSIPYTRCTKEGQEIKEMEIKRQKANRRTSLYDMSDGTQGSSPSDEDSVSE